MKRIVIGDKKVQIDVDTQIEYIKRCAYEHACMFDGNRIEPVKFMEIDAYINDYIRSKWGDVFCDEDDMEQVIEEVVEEWTRDTNVLLKEQDSDRGFIIDMWHERWNVYQGSTASITVAECKLDLDEGEYKPVGMTLMTGAELSMMRRSRCYE